jgi:hypothetical protein
VRSSLSTLKINYLHIFTEKKILIIVNLKFVVVWLCVVLSCLACIVVSCLACIVVSCLACIVVSCLVCIVVFVLCILKLYCV